MKKRLTAIALAVILSAFLLIPAFAEVSSTELRHSVVYVEVGIEGDAGYVGLGSGSGFFIGKTGTDPQYFLTNHHVVNSFIELGGGEKGTDLETFIYWVSKQLFGLSYDKLDSSSQETCINVAAEIWLAAVGNNTAGSFKSKVRVYYDKDDFEEAYLVDIDSKKDMALLRLAKPTDKRAALKISKPVEEMVSKKVYVVGYPGIADNEYYDSVHKNGENDATVTTGTVSRLFIESGTGREAIQTDAAIAHGNSGGPMIFENGAVIGINSWGVTDTQNLEKVNYALSMNEVIPMLERNKVDLVLLSYPNTMNPLIFILIGIAVIAVAAILIMKRRDDGSKDDKKAGADPNDTGLRIQCISGTLGKKRVMIPSNAKVRIGREKDNGIIFPENTEGVSKYHCMVWFENGAVYIQDLGSKFGTYVEPGRRLNPQEKVQIQVGKKFWLGSEKEYECFMIQKKN